MKPFGKYRGLASLILLLVVTPALVWQYAVSDTVKQWRSAGRVRRQVAELQNTGERNEQRFEIPGPSGEMILSGRVVATLLPRIEAEGLRIERFSPYITSETEGVRLVTGQLSVQGGFMGIVELLASMEDDLPGCKIISVRYRAVKPRGRTGVRTLSCTIYIQQITTVD